MAAKLLMKRKRAEDLRLEDNESSNNSSTNSASSSPASFYLNEQNDLMAKRNRLETPTSLHHSHSPHHLQVSSNYPNYNGPDSQEIYQGQVPSDGHNEDLTIPTARNQLLLEALQKIVELQNELDDFEHDLDESDYQEDAEVSYYLDEERQKQEAEVEAYRRHEAEALGFAMCARETLMFLQREGIPKESILYRSLHERLVGQSDDIIPI